MPKTKGYVGRQAENGSFSCHIKKEVNVMLDMFCRINELNKTNYVNNLVQKDMIQKFKRLKEEK